MNCVHGKPLGEHCGLISCGSGGSLGLQGGGQYHPPEFGLANAKPGLTLVEYLQLHQDDWLESSYDSQSETEHQFVDYPALERTIAAYSAKRRL